MTKTEISESKIVKCLFVGNKWKVAVEHNGEMYVFRIEGSKDDSDIVVSNKVYAELKKTKLQSNNAPVVTPRKDGLVNTSPKENNGQ